ncbi:nuclear transport factor 2 family protein [Pantoea cypripedii]|uniref:Nuclear transport factor 2 family protein n=1 Tax=Pantoea cypripedii TaxID=55209 RepID=A0A6B9GGP0_PANCY|nr:nuclear transport factor 2 family protein [Pantoea cypripedii]QGY32466.1 nuclear transport factor 2 family protein [Pantoea cypripedii]
MKEISMSDLLVNAGLLQYLLDRLDIQDTISRYSLGQDSHQGEDSDILKQWDDTFTPEGKVDYTAAGGPAGTYLELAAWMRGKDGQPGSMSSFSNWQHMLSLPIVSVEGNRAQARTDFFATHRGRVDLGANIHFNANGAFHDELERTKKGWRISFRRLELYFADSLAIKS